MNSTTAKGGCVPPLGVREEQNLPAVILGLLPALADAGSSSTASEVAQTYLLELAELLGASSYALLRFSENGRFDNEMSRGFGALSLVTRPSASRMLLLRRMAAARSPVVVSAAHHEASAHAMRALDVRWLLGIPARTATCASGVLIFAGSDSTGPQAPPLHMLRPLSPALASALHPHDTTPVSTTRDPLAALRSARHHRRLRSFSSLLNRLARVCA